MQSLAAAAVAVLQTENADDKAQAARAMAQAWRAGALAWAFDVAAPDRPARPRVPHLLPPNQMPKRGRAGSERARIALIHAVAHIELNAVDLACDMIVRFGDKAPRDFAEDWVRVADEEGLHFSLLQQRLRDWGACYGDLPAHDGLWEAAVDTQGDFIARLVVVPQVLEARGLDVTPTMQRRLRAVGDEAAADILDIILRDEIGHVAVGNRWFGWLCDARGLAREATFLGLCAAYGQTLPRPPFNVAARLAGGFSATELAGWARGASDGSGVVEG